MSWWNIQSRDPFVVCADADDLAQKGTADAIEGRKNGFGPLSEAQRDALAWTARWDAAGGYIMAGLTYRLVYRVQRLVIAAVVMAAMSLAASLVMIAMLLVD
jgi:hypothetical protein